MYVKVVNVIKKTMIYTHEDFVLDLDNATKAKLYFKENLIFMGDGYRAIRMLLRFTGNSQEVRKKFKSQLTLREKPRFNDIE
jgi:hypothetical protein